jgi:cell division protein FtsI (penicillin-binding protein 3)
VNAERLVAKSCNVVTAVYALRLQNKLGRQGYYNYLKELGLFSPSGVGLPNETTGILNENDYAWRRQAATLGFGQSMAATALNVATVYAALGNGGLRMAPRLIDRIGDETLPLAPARRLFQPESAATVLKAMEAAVYAGTGKRAQVRGLTVAGKTGTAQRGNQSKNGYIAGFIGFLPAAQPRAAVFIQIDRPTQGSYYAGQVAAPVFAEIGAFLRDYWELNEPKASGLGGI